PHRLEHRRELLHLLEASEPEDLLAGRTVQAERIGHPAERHWRQTDVPALLEPAIPALPHPGALRNQIRPHLAARARPTSRGEEHLTQRVPGTRQRLGHASLLKNGAYQQGPRRGREVLAHPPRVAGQEHPIDRRDRSLESACGETGETLPV